MSIQFELFVMLAVLLTVIHAVATDHPELDGFVHDFLLPLGGVMLVALAAWRLW